MSTMGKEEYLAYLEELKETLGRLVEIQNRKVKAVRAHDLEQLDECMKQEQAISLSLRGMEHRRDKLTQELGLKGVPLREVPRRCPAESYGAVSQVVEDILRQNQLLRSAQKAARTIMEKELRAVNRELERQGVDVGGGENYPSPSGQALHGMHTDFRA